VRLGLAHTLQRVTRVTRKGLLSRSVTASLLIENYQCMKEAINLMFSWPREADTLLKPAGGNRDA